MLSRDKLWHVEARLRRKAQALNIVLGRTQTNLRKLYKKVEEIEGKRLKIEVEEFEEKKIEWKSAEEAAKARKRLRKKNASLIEEFEKALRRQDGV